MNDSKPSINDFPRDLLALVLSFLSVNDYLRATDLVSKAFHHASKHPLCWDALMTFYPADDTAVTKAVNYFTKYECNPLLWIGAASVSAVSLHTLSRLTNLRRLHLNQRYPHTSSITALLSSLNQLERFSATVKCHPLEFPSMPQLHTVDINCPVVFFTDATMDLTGLHRLSDLTIRCEYLRQLRVPDSVKTLQLYVRSCSPQASTSVAKLPSLEAMTTTACSDVLSQPDLHFTSTITTLDTWRRIQKSSQARENVRRMTNLTQLILRGMDASADHPEFVEVIASLPSLTSLCASDILCSADLDLAPFSHASSLQHLQVEHLPQDALQPLALPSLTSLELKVCSDITSLAPLAACVNLTTLRAEVKISEQDAQVLSGLTKLETLHVHAISDHCFAHICRLSRLKELDVFPSWNYKRQAGHVALLALAGLAPTIEKLALPELVDPQHDVMAVSHLVRLRHFSTEHELTEAHVLLLRSSLPRLCRLVSHGLSL